MIHLFSKLPTSARSALPAVLLALVLGGLTGCASQPAPDAPPAVTARAAAPLEPVPEPEIEYGSFTEEQLYQAIISELGAQRGELRESGDSYFDLAMETRDLGILERALQFATRNGDSNAILQLGLLWAEIEPGNSRPQLLLALQFLEEGDFSRALQRMGRVLELGGDIDFSALAARTGRLPPRARNGLINNLRQLAQDYPGNPSIQTSLVQLLAQNGQFDQAIDALDTLEAQFDSSAELNLLRAQIHQSNQSPELALDALRAGVRRFPESRDLRLNLARLLVNQQDYAAAQRQFAALVEMDPEDWDTVFSVALLDLEIGNFDDAEQRLSRLLEAGQRVNESRYYLGFVNQEQGELRRAVEHFRQVGFEGPNFLAAQQQATRLSIQLGELEDAHNWLTRLSRGQPRLEVQLITIESGALIVNGYMDEAKALLDRSLNRFPNDTDLLFSRVLWYDQRGDQAGSEADLRQIIRMQPEDSRALNHLGYMLADQTDRFDEALALAERAIAISPDDPAIIDTLAWAQYKTGDYESALQNLRRAFAVFPDPEVASHLGEVLWAMGRRDEAREVWFNALEQAPGDELILEVLERFDVSE
jgi:tetratricopeptide (TPR) repeat protein